MTDMSLEPQLKQGLRRPRPVVVAVGAILAIYLLTPALIVIPASITSGQYIEVPPNGFSLRWFQEVFENQVWVRALWTSVQVSGIAAIVAVIIATLAVIGLSRTRRAARWLRPVFFLPMVLPIIVFALGIGRVTAALEIRGSLVPLMIGQAVLCIPIAFISVASGMGTIDPALTRAAQSMGAPWWRTVWKVELPLLRRSILTGFLLAFAFGFDEVVLALFLAPPGQTTLPAKLYVEATQAISPLLASVSVLIILLTVIVAVIALVTLRGTRRRALARASASSTNGDPA